MKNAHFLPFVKCFGKVCVFFYFRSIAKQKMKETGIIEQLSDAFKSLQKMDSNEQPVVSNDEEANAKGLIELIKQATEPRAVSDNAAAEVEQVAEKVEQAADTIVVSSNTTLGHLAKQYYGNAAMWTKIFEANRDVLTSPDQIKEGMKLIIPKE